MNIPDAMVTAGAIAGDVPDYKARQIIEAALAAVDPEWRTEVILEAKGPPDNGTVEEVLLEILRCANAWAPEARIIGNVRAGDIGRVVSEILIANLSERQMIADFCAAKNDWPPKWIAAALRGENDAYAVFATDRRAAILSPPKQEGA